MTDLTDFLLARIAEDEATARDGEGWRGRLWNGEWQIIDREDDEVVATVSHDFEWGHIARHDPARVLAECEAKRRVVERWRLYSDAEYPDYEGGYASAMDAVLATIALPYADHPDFREEWRA